MTKDFLDGRSARAPGGQDNEPDSVEYLLGQLGLPEASAFEAAAATDATRALDLATTNRLLQRFRALPVPVAGVAAVRLRAMLLQRGRLLDNRPRGPFSWTFEIVLIAAILLLGSLLSLREVPQINSVPARLVETVASVPSPLQKEQGRTTLAPSKRVSSQHVHSQHGSSQHGPSQREQAIRSLKQDASRADVDALTREKAALEESVRSAAQAMAVFSDPDVFASLVAADNDLARLRMEFRQRYSPQSRRETIAWSGGSPALEDRIQDLAADVAGRFHERTVDSATPADLSVGLRALLAAGSTARIGHHRDVVRLLGQQLVQRIPDLQAGDLAVALSALTDLAIVAGGPFESVVGQQTGRLVASLMASTVELPSPLLQWSTPESTLGEVGRVLSLAPAFGVHPTFCHRARIAVFDHLQERLRSGAYERPEVLAALVYGFCDLVDRHEIDRRLVLWPPRQIARNSMAAVHHLAWSIYPPRPGLAQWQQDLRGLAALKTPTATADAASLLLCLTTSYAAPGVAQVLALVGR